ncbi:MAG: three-Cys-motif partner protein TcmP [Spirochaetaceae bacterium]|nr:three-Cys-motif partner protein TcmP [Spirochaetaceae bacterium]
MSNPNKEFFKEKKIWSEIKDELLTHYLTPYFSKILETKKPLLYVDCFAGKGKFDDGKDGSPLTALHKLNEIIDNKHKNNRSIPTVSMKFIELNWADELNINIPQHYQQWSEIINGKFEDNIKNLLQNTPKDFNIFLYIDPYGIKALNATLFKELPTKFNTAELLINFNSHGFLREACRVKKITLREQEDEFFSDLKEYDSSIFQHINELNDIADGDYWQAIIEEYYQEEINWYQAEQKFSYQYKQCLKKKYKYVLDMPICLKKKSFS